MINSKLLKDILNLNLEIDVEFACLGLIDSNIENTLTFIDNNKYIKNLLNNKNISAVFVNEDLAHKIKQMDADTPINFIICEDARNSFYSLFNYISKKMYKKEKTIVKDNCVIHPSAQIAEHNVVIGNNVIIEPNVTILPDVTIDDNVVIRAGAVIGSEGFEHKRTVSGILSVVHTGKVIIGSNVEIGVNSCIDKGLSYRDTIIRQNTKIDNLVHIAHCVEIGENCLIAASAIIAGSVTIGNDVWIGPGASISNSVTIGNRGYVTLGSVVVRNVSEGEKVTGNFAMPHDKFSRNYIKSLKL